MDGNKSVTANFQVKEPDTYTLTPNASPSAGGTVSGGGIYKSGDVVTLQATPAAGYTFNGWSGDATGTSSSITITMDGNKSVTANFEANNPTKYTISAVIEPAGGGSVEGLGDYDPGSEATLKAIAADGYIFIGWSGDATGRSLSMNITMNGNKSVIANFREDTLITTYILATDASPSEGGSVEGGGVYSDGSVVPVTAIPAAGYTFVSWSGDVTGTSSSLNITMDRDKTVTANFEKSVNAANPAKLFSPDNRGDSRSEVWQIENAYLLDGAEISIYDRQGGKVYSSTGYAVPWDGTSAGKPLPDGAYFYIIVYANDRKQTGSVTIARLK